MRGRITVATTLGVAAAVAVAVLLQSCGSDDAVAPTEPCLVGLVPVDALSALPIRLHVDPPHYPAAALNDGWSGSGTSYAIINPDSSICDYGIAASSGRADVDAEILAVTRTAVFVPGMVGSTMVRSRVEMTVIFGLPAEGD